MRRAVAFVVSLGLLVVAPPAGAQDDQPTVELLADEVELGDALRLEGAGWPADTLVTGVICGNAALDGSVDCDLARSSSNAVASDGTVRLELEVAEPPRPCPCLVRVTDAANAIRVDTPVEIEGVDTEEPRSRVAPEGLAALEVVDVEVRGNGPVLSWFGAPPERELVVTVDNVGSEAVTGVMLLASWTDDDGATRVLDAVEFPTVGTEDDVTFAVSMRFDVLASGTYRVGGELVAEGDAIAFATVTEVRPWGLYVLGAVLVVALVGWVLARIVRWVLRRRRARRETEAAQSAPDRAELIQRALLDELDEEQLARLAGLHLEGRDEELERQVTIRVENAVASLTDRFELSPRESRALVARVARELLGELSLD